MLVATEAENSRAIDPLEYVRRKEEHDEKRAEFMRKQLRRTWPTRVVRLLGVFQLLISLAILGVDLPVILMFAPRWQVFAGCWTFIFGFLACVSTLHSARRMTWLKLKWAVALNALAGLAAALLICFNILYLVNPYICLLSTGCNYLWYTYSAANPFYVAEVILGIALFITVFIFLILFIKYGIGGATLFEDIHKGLAPAIFDPIVPPHGTRPVPANPVTGSGVLRGRPPPPPPPGFGPRYPPPGFIPRYPPPGFIPRYPPPGSMPRSPPPGFMPRSPPPGFMPRYPPPPPPGSMLRYPPRPPGVMMTRPPIPTAMVGPDGSMMVPVPVSPPPGFYRQPGPLPSAAQRYQSQDETQ